MTLLVYLAVLYIVKHCPICYIIAMEKEVTACPITKVAELLSDSWSMLILYQLNRGVKGFCELERVLEGISTRTLTLKLKRLMEDGLIEKNNEGLYLTTPRGRGLKVVENAMRMYERKYL